MKLHHLEIKPKIYPSKRKHKGRLIGQYLAAAEAYWEFASVFVGCTTATVRPLATPDLTRRGAQGRTDGERQLRWSGGDPVEE